MRKLTGLAIVAVLGWAESSVQFAPPPAVFLGNYDTQKPQKKAGLTLMNYQGDTMSLSGLGFEGSQQWAQSENLWFGVSIGGYMMSGQTEDSSFDVTMTNIPMSAVAGWRVEVDSDLELGFVAGPVLGLNSVYMTGSTSDVYGTLSSMGFQAGMIAYLSMGQGVGFTPYLLAQQQSGGGTINTDIVNYGRIQESVSYDYSSQTIGFDITFGTYSLGAMVQSLKEDDDASDMTLLRFAAEF